MHGSTIVSEQLADGRAFAESVAGVVARHHEIPDWTPGGTDVAGSSTRLAEALHSLGWLSLAEDPELVVCAGLAGVELGRAAAPVSALDQLLGAAPLAGDLIRCPTWTGRQSLDSHPRGVGLVVQASKPATAGPREIVRRPVSGGESCPSPEGLDVWRVTDTGDAEPVDADTWAIAWGAWVAASTGYLAGLGEAALQLTVEYVRERAAFGTTLGALAPVQQLLADAATAVRGVTLLCADAPGEDALRHAGPAISGACDACHQVTGAIGYTLEYPLHGYSQRARALATWNDALLDAFAG
ncbi:MAG TPA: acyl-CoA dehydrogenase family protein [Solirubrobacteraceae bacterium]|nr:acyl-CoA dehydrogenase family protein [Solirubrobacteraceae bacterium]